MGTTFLACMHSSRFAELIRDQGVTFREDGEGGTTPFQTSTGRLIVVDDGIPRDAIRDDLTPEQARRWFWRQMNALYRRSRGGAPTRGARPEYVEPTP